MSSNWDTAPKRFSLRCTVLNFLYGTFTMYSGAGTGCDMVAAPTEYNEVHRAMLNRWECPRCGRGWFYISTEQSKDLWEVVRKVKQGDKQGWVVHEAWRAISEAWARKDEKKRQEYLDHCFPNKQLREDFLRMMGQMAGQNLSKCCVLKESG